MADIKPGDKVAQSPHYPDGHRWIVDEVDVVNNVVRATRPGVKLTDEDIERLNRYGATIVIEPEFVQDELRLDTTMVVED